MLKSKIAKKLALNFAVALLIFSLVISVMFVFLFGTHTLNIHRADLEERARSIAETLAGFMESGVMRGSGYGGYLRSIGDIAGAKVWLIDRNLNLITHGRAGRNYNYGELPQNAGDIINEVFHDKVVFSEGFSGVLSELTLTVGVPIKSTFGNILGVVLLHSPVDGINHAIYQGFAILGGSIALALFVAIGMSVVFSYSFTKPLNRMNEFALRLSGGGYGAKNGVVQNDEIGELAKTLDVLSERLYSASIEGVKLERMRRDFTANISHELRTPVTVLRGSLEALADKVVTDPVKVEDYYLQMLNEAKFLERLVGDLLDLSRLQNIDFAMEMNDISMRELILDAVRSAEHLAKKKNIEIKYETSDLKIIGDYGRIRQMLMIVLDNAIKFSPNGGTVDVSWDAGKLVITDRGPGIPQEYLPFIFDRFYKARSEQNKSGTGLGLAIAKQISERHGIKIDIRSNMFGTQFIFCFPKI